MRPLTKECDAESSELLVDISQVVAGQNAKAALISKTSTEKRTVENCMEQLEWPAVPHEMREQELHSPEKISLSQCSQFHVASGVFLARISAEGVRAANDDEGSYFEIPAKTSQGNVVRVDTLCE